MLSRYCRNQRGTNVAYTLPLRIKLKVVNLSMYLKTIDRRLVWWFAYGSTTVEKAPSLHGQRTVTECKFESASWQL